MLLSRHHVLLSLFTGAVLLAGLSACSSSSTTQAPPPVVETVEAEPEPAGPAYSVLYFNEAGLQQRDLRSDQQTLLVPDASYLGLQSVSPDGRWLAVGYETGSGSSLAMIDLEAGSVWNAHSTTGKVVYSAAWSGDGASMAFGYYTPQQSGMGPGGIQVATPSEQTTRNVGCSASKEAVQWLPDGRLAVSDGRNIYLVDNDGCGTLNTLDARKLHHVAFSPDGQWMSYVFRDLVYNRAARKYEPDSTLFIADAQGANPRKIVSQKYVPRNMAWSPDGTELAFDVQSQENPEQRYITIYNVAQEKTVYLTPPDAMGTSSETRPRWSPKGERMVFDRIDGGTRTLTLRTFMEQFARVAGEGGKQLWGWAGEDALILSDGEGVSVVPVETLTPIPLEGVDTLLYVRPE